MRARGIIVFSKSQLVGQKYQDKTTYLSKAVDSFVFCHLLSTRRVFLTAVEDCIVDYNMKILFGLVFFLFISAGRFSIFVPLKMFHFV